jgi:TetR/AcrR family acrAB operon transcriptional repressor
VRCRRVFEILTRKCEYVDELHGLSQRILRCRTQGLEMMEQAVRNAVRRGQLPARINAARAALGLHAYVDGLIYDWLLDPGYFDLAREAEALVDQYLEGLKAAPASSAAPAPRVKAGRAALAKQRTA